VRNTGVFVGGDMNSDPTSGIPQPIESRVNGSVWMLVAHGTHEIGGVEFFV
jgi:hypothetical protein